jgi:lipopolysaccharide/colanic/teichoic acid biosynthesis glycosyltransferase
MVVDAEKASGATWAQKNDTRITPIGKFLRKTRIDELPQSWSVLKGDMSIIGPRPERQFFVEKLKKEIPFYDTRHLVKPGLTGWAQVLYPYGSDTHDAMMKLQYDLFYIKNRSMLLDLKIILKTISVVIRFKGL